MKIQNDPLRALLEPSEAHRKPKTEGMDFESMLVRELQGNTAAQAGMVQNAEQNTAALAMQIRAVQELEGVEAEAEDQSDSMYTQKMENLLDKWDQYSQALAKPETASLKEVNSLLSGMSSELAALKATLPKQSGDKAGLAGLVNELEVMTTTERIKFNRGDYL